MYLYPNTSDVHRIPFVIISWDEDDFPDFADMDRDEEFQSLCVTIHDK